MTIHPAAHPRSIPAIPESDDKATTRLRLNCYNRIQKKAKNKIRLDKIREEKQEMRAHTYTHAHTNK